MTWPNRNSGSEWNAIPGPGTLRSFVMIHTSIPNPHKPWFLVPVLAFTSMLLMASTTMSYAQSAQPPARTAPPATNNAPGTAPGNTDGETTMPPKPGRGYSDEDHDTSTEPFGRGCPFQDNDLQLVS